MGAAQAVLEAAPGQGAARWVALRAAGCLPSLGAGAEAVVAAEVVGAVAAAGVAGAASQAAAAPSAGRPVPAGQEERRWSSWGLGCLMAAAWHAQAPHLLLFGNSLCTKRCNLDRRQGLVVVDATKDRRRNKNKPRVLKHTNISETHSPFLELPGAGGSAHPAPSGCGVDQAGKEKGCPWSVPFQAPAEASTLATGPNQQAPGAQVSSPSHGPLLRVCCILPHTVTYRPP